MAVKGINGADLNNISKVDGRSNVLDKVNGVDADLSPPAVAYSVRNVSGLTGISYDGPAMRILVDATGDGADATDLEFDINFTADGDLDVADIELKCAGGKDAYVVKWYDQSGAGRDATQTAYADMPKIATAGVVILENGQPAVEFEATSPTYGLNTPIIDVTPGHTIAVTRFDSTSNDYSYCIGSTSTEGLLRHRANRLMHVATNNTKCAYEKIYRNSTDLLQLTPSVNEGFAGSVFQQNLFFTDDATVNGVSMQHIGKNPNNNANYRWYGTIQEIIAYSSNQSDKRLTIENNINSYFNIYQSRENILPGAAAAYSLRQLSDSSRLAIRVRRDTGVGSGTDDDEADVGFDANGELSLASPVSNFDPTGSAATTLGEFLADAAYDDEDSLGAPADGFVTAWYDQSVNANNATQTSPASQPKIYDSSTGLIKENGKPALDLDGTNALIISVTGTAIDLTAFLVRALPTYPVGALTQNPFHYKQRGIGYNQYAGYANAHLVNGTNLVQNAAGYPTTTGQALDYFLNQSELYRNSTVQTLSTGSAYNSNNTSVIGGWKETSQRMTGTLQEIILYESDESSNRTDIEGNINAHYGIKNFGTPSSGLLADYPGSAAAYSVRKLADTASLAMRIIVDDTAVIGTVDASDTEYDIGFDANGDLDVARIREVCNNPSGANYNAYVVTWYDQSGNGNHATQTTYTDCPQIYDGVDVIMENGKPAIYHNDQTLVVSSFTGGASSGTIVGVLANIENNGIPWLSNGTGGPFFLRTNQGQFADSAFRALGTVTAHINNVTDTDYQQGDSWNDFNSSQGLMFLDCDTSATTNANFNICHQRDVHWQELIFWDSDQDGAGNRKGIETDIDSYYRIYGDPDDGLLSTPYGKGAAAAYSVRRLSNNATRAMRILVDADANGPDASDNEYDIGFDANGELDIARIEELCDKGTGNYDAYVTTWYDQSGEGNDATQATYSAMPKICDAGTVILENGKPAIESVLAGAQGLSIPTLTIDQTDFSVSHVAKFFADSGIFDNGTFFFANSTSTGATNSTKSMMLMKSSFWLGTNSVSSYANRINFTATTNQRLFFANGVNLFIDGSSVGTHGTSGDATYSSLQNSVVSNDFNRDAGCHARTQELILWGKNKTGNRTLIESNINDYFDIEGV